MYINRSEIDATEEDLPKDMTSFFTPTSVEPQNL